MLAIISDLHLQHVSDDVLHFRDGRRLMEAGVRRNVSAGALRRFLHMACATAKRHESKTAVLSRNSAAGPRTGMVPLRRPAVVLQQTDKALAGRPTRFAL
ncbi:MAG: hypothetical protein ACYTEZ_16635 [Planctomycetota bacterium]|jgi:hypothetical protein